MLKISTRAESFNGRQIRFPVEIPPTAADRKELAHTNPPLDLAGQLQYYDFARDPLRDINR